MLQKKLLIRIIVCCLGAVNLTIAQSDVFQWKDAQTLIINDGMSKQTYLWKNGTLWLTEAHTHSATDTFTAPIADISISEAPLKTTHNIQRISETERTLAYWQLELHSIFSKYEIKRTLRVYDNTTGIEWRLSVKGNNQLFSVPSISDNGLIEDASLLSGNIPHYYAFPLVSPHVTTKIISFQEATDHHSNIANVKEELPYRKPQYYKGSVLLTENNNTRNVHLLVKLSPLQDAQSDYAGFDFSTDFSAVKVFSSGIDTQADMNLWQEAYPIFSVMYASNEEEALHAYKRYELSVHRYLPKKDNTFTMNTWGDRNRDSRINEKFILNELEAAAQLGITHYQIDDGWQQGTSSNSANKTNNSRWDDWSKSDWNVHATRFPKGLSKVQRKAKSLGIELGLWFNPSKNDNYHSWERDRDIILDLHRKHHISWIKIDGLLIGNKQAETRVQQLLQEARQQSNGLQFNIDVTAGKRGGYFFLNHLGNIFLENRYTDWGNYYPHLTLRNIWTLSKYVPVQRFQIEWLNKWRNENKYPKNDFLKPKNIPFDYQFAITMMGQPLAWMEATGLPNEAFSVTSLINSWKKERNEMQSGIIHPVGKMPNGHNFTGFVSYAQNKTYVLLFRENTSTDTFVFEFPFGNFSGKRFVKLAGEGECVSAENHSVKANFSNNFQFLWGYFE